MAAAWGPVIALTYRLCQDARESITFIQTILDQPAIMAVARLTDIAKKEAVTEACAEATRFVDIVKNEAITKSVRLDGIAKVDDIAYSANARSIAQDKMANTILDLTVGNPK